jgi:glyoxylase-like metal-dependent hydrolase (beta-lactamase superfamily II)
MAEAPDSPYPPEIKEAFLSQMFDYLDYTVTVDGTLKDDEELPFCGGIKVIHTPGHTPGHICLYISQSKTLVAGDAISAEGGKLGPVPKFASLDWRLALKSLDKLAGYDIETAVCYHGGVWRGDVRRSIAEFAGE